MNHTLTRKLAPLAAAVALGAGLLIAPAASAVPAADCGTITFGPNDGRLNVGQSAQVDIVRKRACADATVLVEQRINGGPWTTVLETNDRARHLRFNFTPLEPSANGYRVHITPSKGPVVKRKTYYFWS